MGCGDYSYGAEWFHSLDDNLEALKEKYVFENGYFGERSKGHSEDRRIIISKNPLETALDFYKIATQGGIPSELENGKGIRTDMFDGTCFTLREVSKSDGSPAINISVRKAISNNGFRTQKIHFTLGDN